ncbi:MAG: C4-dicarboxylate ABC transporter substrate-binding protein, partial [Bradyrhizobium sp.]|nr:C4-dicarboxylate ABC transporter substrate-binding protein [Bradyrhizobium sp.]
AADTPTIGTSAAVVTSANVSTKAVLAITQATIAQISELRTKHPALASLTVEEMTGGSIPAPFHPAASQVYKDLGLLK